MQEIVKLPNSRSLLSYRSLYNRLKLNQIVRNSQYCHDGLRERLTHKSLKLNQSY